MNSARMPRGLKLRDGRTIRFPAVMGVLNVTPDSFSDGGRYLDPLRALEHALEMEEAGADVIDLGGESTRPAGARTVSAEVELERVGPVLQKLGARLRVPISIDTRKAAVARAALDHGAAMINDISALTADPNMAALAAHAGCPVVLMHMRGSIENHIRSARYRDVVKEVREYLRARVRFALASGIASSRIIVDPGLGFAKLAVHNLALLRGLPSLCALGYPVLIGASRKTFIRGIAGDSRESVTFASATVDAFAVASGAAMVRVHDVAASKAAIRIATAYAGHSMR